MLKCIKIVEFNCFSLRCGIYLNRRRSIFIYSPIFARAETENFLGDFLGKSVDYAQKGLRNLRMGILNPLFIRAWGMHAFQIYHLSVLGFIGYEINRL